MAIVDTGKMQVEVIQFDFIVSDDGLRRDTYDPPLNVIVGPGGPADTLCAYLESAPDMIVSGVDKIDVQVKLKALLFEWHDKLVEADAKPTAEAVTLKEVLTARTSKEACDLSKELAVAATAVTAEAVEEAPAKEAIVKETLR